MRCKYVRFDGKRCDHSSVLRGWFCMAHLGGYASEEDRKAQAEYVEAQATESPPSAASAKGEP